MKILFINILVIAALLVPTRLQASTINDTLYVNGPNYEHLSKYVTCWIDSSGYDSSNINDAINALENDKFRSWKANTTLNLGQNPHPFWLHLTVKNNSTKYHNYWWSLYSHADFMYAFEKKEESWVCIDTVVKAAFYTGKKIPVRFPATELSMKHNESKELLLLVMNPRHSQNSIMSFTTPHDNLLWEKQFYWNIGFFTGCFLFIGFICLVVSGVMREAVFFQYGLYLILIVCIMMIEELILIVIENRALFYFANRLHSLPLIIISLAIHFKIIAYILDFKKYSSKWLRIINKINTASLFFGIVTAILYFTFIDSIHFGQLVYHFLWKLHIFIILMLLINIFLLILLLTYKKKLLPVGIVFGALVLYLNPAGYFLNYSGILSYYHLTYPNYFYWVVCLECIILAGIITWRYKITIAENYKLIEEKAIIDEISLRREIEIQQEERKQIARDLHDELGTTISAIKLIITNSYSHDSILVNMINKANTDVRHFFSKLFVNKNELSIFSLVRKKVTEFNRIDGINIEFIAVGKEEHLKEHLIYPVSRIATEFLSNIIKHSKATEATIQLIIESHQVQIIAEDNGIGFSVRESKPGMGMSNIKDIAEKHNGNFYISSNSSGTSGIITIPIN